MMKHRFSFIRFDLQTIALFLSILFLSLSPISKAAEESSFSIEKFLTASSEYLRYGVGIHEGTELPYERLHYKDGQIEKWDKRTQPTLIGFYLQILIDIAKGNLEVSFISPEAAEKRLDRLMDQLLEIQARDGWHGLLPTWGVVGEGYQKSADNLGTGDNLNLSSRVCMILGAFEPERELYQKADKFLDLQRLGYFKLIDRNKMLFFGGARDGELKTTYHLNRVSNEFSVGVAWAVAYYGFSERLYLNQKAKFRKHMLLTWNGDGFEMSWRLLTFNEMQFRYFNMAHHNYLFDMFRLARLDQQPGLRSPGDGPNGKYMISGYAKLSERANLHEIDQRHWVHYVLGNYYLYDVARTTIKMWYEQYASLEEAWLPAGLQDGGVGSYDTKIRFSNTILGIDHLSAMLGFFTKGPQYLEKSLERKEALSAMKKLYRDYEEKNFRGKIKRIPGPFAYPPVKT